MRKAVIFTTVSLLSLCICLLSDFGRSSAQRLGDTAMNEKPSRTDDRQLGALIRSLTNRTTDGLQEFVTPGDGTALNLDGRFQNVVIGKINAKGDPVAACVTSIDEANQFFGRDLDTGRPIATPFPEEDIESIATRHGMSVDEFLFYSRMVSEAVLNEVVASPSSATITIVNNDGANEGFNDTLPAFVVGEGGNSGTTRGQQRLNVFNFAGAIWGAFLDSNVPILVGAQMNPQTCSTSGAVLGSAGTTYLIRDFGGAELTGTWYHAALANKQAGFDLSSANPDINTIFNSQIDTGCLAAGSRWYYGLDNSTPSLRINLLVVVLHEMGHGLGFSTFANGSTGTLNGGLPDVWSRFMYDNVTGLHWNAMTDAQRQASAISNGALRWDGPNVVISSDFLTAGRDTAGRVHLYAPTTFASGSSVSHFSTLATPNLLMEPSINPGLPIDLDLSRQLMRDIGWYRDTTTDNVPDTITNVTPNSGFVLVGNNVNITWNNTGGFNRNVTIELSTNGGTTYSAIATNVANSGSFAWTVPGTTTTQARIRVREAGFVAPAGVSSANFSISLVPSSGRVSVSGRVYESSGRSIAGATVRLVGENGETFSAITNAFGYYAIGGLRGGSSYTATVAHKGYAFETRFITLENDLTGLDFEPSQSVSRKSK